MTKADKQRVKLLTAVSKKSCGMGDGKIVSILCFVGVLLIDVALFIAAGADNELYMMLPFHVFIITLFMGFLSTFTTSLVGDVQNLFGVDNSAMLYGGTIKSGDFLSTLPFSAKDIIALKLANFERQLVLSAASVILMEIMLIIAENAGYAVYSGIGAIGVVTYLLFEVMFMLLVFARKAVTSFVVSIIGMIAVFGPFMALADVAEDHEKSAELGKLIDSIGFLAEVPGMIILAVLTVAIIAIGRAILNSKHGVSWNLR